MNQQLVYIIGLVLLVLVLVIMLIVTVVRRPITCEGKIVKKDISRANSGESYVTIVTKDGTELELIFETRFHVSCKHRGDQCFHGAGETLDNMFFINQTLKVKYKGGTNSPRYVWKLVSPKFT